MAAKLLSNDGDRSTYLLDNGQTVIVANNPQLTNPMQSTPVSNPYLIEQKEISSLGANQYTAPIQDKTGTGYLGVDTDLSSDMKPEGFTDAQKLGAISAASKTGKGLQDLKLQDPSKMYKTSDKNNKKNIEGASDEIKKFLDSFLDKKGNVDLNDIMSKLIKKD